MRSSAGLAVGTLRENGVLASFMAITQCATEARAIGLLLSADGDLNRAINFYLSLTDSGLGNERSEPLGASRPARVEASREARPDGLENKGETVCIAISDEESDSATETVEQTLLSLEAPPTKDAPKMRGPVRTISSCKVPCGWSCAERDEVYVQKELASSRDLIHQEVLSFCAKGELFRDAAFPPTLTSIDGKGRPASTRRRPDAHRRRATQMQNLTDEGETPHCACKMKCRLCTVVKDGVNQGRLFWACFKKACGYFEWADHNAPHSSRVKALVWRRLSPPLYQIVNSKGYLAGDIRQGSVGDCWFLSALSVLAERRDLIKQIVDSRFDVHNNGAHVINLCIDGVWQAVVVDSFLPQKIDARGIDGFQLAFSRAADQQLWVALVEKAYAKVHGSYEAISGGYIEEAMFDLTGYPTESIAFDSRDFDSDTFWARMASWNDQGFPMGAATSYDPSLRNTGLVGTHAYSVLDVKEVLAQPGHQTKIHDYFAACGSNTARQKKTGKTEKQLLRMIKLRNPWGRKEWKGDWGESSDLWTRRLLGLLDKGEKNDGTFWMSYEDFMCRFSELDVCKAHRNWYSYSCPGSFQPHQLFACRCYLLRVSEPSWLYLTTVQKTKRGRGHERFFYSDLSLLLLKVIGDPESRSSLVRCERVALVGTRRKTIMETFLDDTSATYVLIPMSLLSDREQPFIFRVFSATPVLVKQADTMHQLQAWGSTPSSIIHKCLLTSSETVQAATHYKVQESCTLSVIKGDGLCLFFVLNAHPSEEVEIRLALDGNNVAALEDRRTRADGLLHVVCPNSQHVIAAAVSTSTHSFLLRYAFKLGDKAMELLKTYGDTRTMTEVVEVFASRDAVRGLSLTSGHGYAGQAKQVSPQPGGSVRRDGFCMPLHRSTLMTEDGARLVSQRAKGTIQAMGCGKVAGRSGNLGTGPV